MSKKISLEEMSGVIREILDSSGEVSFVSSGRSMIPTIRDRQDVITLIKPQDEIVKNDVVFYQRDNGQYILHRVMHAQDGKFVMRGDNQWYNEYNIRREQIIGVLASFDRNGRTHKVTDRGYRIYVKLLPAIRYVRKYYYQFKSEVYKFLKFLFKK